MTDKTIRVLIIEDHQIVADGLTALLNDQRDMTVVGNVGSVAESAPAASELSPDVVLVDFRLNDGTGADAAAAIRRVNPSARHIFLTREDSDVARFAALESGASGFIHKSKAASEVVDAIRKVASGGTLITPTAIAALLNRRRTITRWRLVLSLGRAFGHKVGGFCRVKSGHTERERAHGR